MKTIHDKINNVRISNGEILELNDLGLLEIPAQVFELKQLKILRLRRNKIKNIPTEIKCLDQLIELNLIDNELESFPESLTSLKSLQILHLRKNKISSIPKSISNLKLLTHLNLGNNNLVSLPQEIGDLDSLIHLFVKNNEIKRLPSSIKKLENIKELMLNDNPIIYPPKEVLDGGLMRILLFFFLEESDFYNSSNLTFKIPKELRTAIKQYLSYFPEYVEISKGKNIQFETKSHDEGVTIVMSDKDSIEELNEYFNEYLGFVKTNIESIAPKIEIVLSETQRDLFILELKQQVIHLKNQVEIREFKLKYLENQVEQYFDLLKLEKTNPNPVFINTIATSNSNVEAKIEIISNLKVEFPVLQNNVYHLLHELPEDTPSIIKEEIKQIDDELIEQGNISSQNDINKTPLKRIKRLFDQITDEESEFSKVIKKSQKLKKSVQNLGKTYNKIAQWTGLPNIPDLILEL
ncbi:leucine-rich repeat domain-containing protein [Neotamlana sedimentorum]|uniref:leucine-rich repeat domain-containing protein n=1 Tax=Neotamlana sedimentorum TaxID=1435349 RepID=UPI00069C1C60|nr:leucine-rich repeat domain-containing protein [Tamlana sedimentorum]